MHRQAFLLPSYPGDEMPDYSPWETDEVRDKGHLHVQVCGKLPHLSLCFSSGLRLAFPIPLWVLVLPAFPFPSRSPAPFPSLSSSPVHYYDGAADFGGSFFVGQALMIGVLMCEKTSLASGSHLSVKKIHEEQARLLSTVYYLQ